MSDFMHLSNNSFGINFRSCVSSCMQHRLPRQAVIGLVLVIFFFGLEFGNHFLSRSLFPTQPVPERKSLDLIAWNGSSVNSRCNADSYYNADAFYNSSRGFPHVSIVKINQGCWVNNHWEIYACGQQEQWTYTARENHYTGYISITNTCRPMDQEYIPGLSLHVETAVLTNPGHQLADEVWPTFQAILMLGCKLDANKTSVWKTLERDLTEATFQDNFAVLTNAPLQSLQNKVLCFEEVIVGRSVLLGFAHAPYGPVRKNYPCLLDFGETMTKMRLYTLSRFGLGPAGKRTIILAKKPNYPVAHPMNIANLERIQTLLQQEFPELETRIVIWHGLPLQDQVRIMNSAKVYHFSNS